MIASLLWKEYREHRAVWLTLAALGVLVLVGVPGAFAPEGVAAARGLREFLQIMAAVLAWTYGMVCGGMLLAGEREAGTQAFLDALPALRARLWRAKSLTGAAFLLAQVALLVGLGLWTGLAEGPLEVAAGVALLVVAGALGFAWGMLCSAVSGNVLNAVGLALVGQFFAAAVVFVPALLVGAVFTAVFNAPSGGVPVAVVSSAALLTVAPLVGSALLYSRPDQLRRRPAEGRERGLGSGLGLRRLLWLSWQQTRGLALGVGLFSLAVGIFMPMLGLVLWPVLTLGVGALCGVTAFLDEQQSGASRFLGEQRLPPGRVWLVKVGVRLALTGACLVLMLLPAVLVTAVRRGVTNDRLPFPGAVFDSQLVYYQIPLGVFLLSWAAYGFGVGQVAGLLFRNAVVALVVALGGSALLVSVWVPSMAGGGLELWQVLGVPVILLAAGRALMHPWAAGRVVSWGVAGRVALALCLCLGWTAGGLWYRVAEVPDVHEPDDFADYLESLPAPEENEVGSRLRGVLSRVSDLARAVAARPQFPEGQPGPGRTFLDDAEEAVERGWPPEGAEFGKWLDEVFADDCWRRLAWAADKPPGLIEDPRRLTVTSAERPAEAARSAALLLAARGLQRQAQGDPAAFVDNLRDGLALARSLQHRSTVLSTRAGWAVEATLLAALDPWLGRLDGEPELLRRALGVLRAHQAGLSNTFSDQQKSEYLLALNSLDEPPQWLPTEDGDVVRVGGGRLEPALLTLAWGSPWEHARRRRLARVLAWGSEEQRREFQRRAEVVVPYWPAVGRLQEGARRRDASLRAARLKVALRLYEAEAGEPAPSLAVLVRRGYLEEVPRDPFDGQPFRYRLSRGEKVAWPEKGPVGAPGVAPGVPGAPVLGQPTREVKPGQGVLWCVGEDLADDSGLRQGEPLAARTQPGEDVIFLVPMRPDKGR